MKFMEDFGGKRTSQEGRGAACLENMNKRERTQERRASVLAEVAQCRVRLLEGCEREWGADERRRVKSDDGERRSRRRDGGNGKRVACMQQK